MGHTDAVVVLTTLATTDEAAKFVRALLERRLVACGTILPAARSLYRWEDKLADETEVVVVLKTRSGAVHGLERAFKELHPYKVPELLAVPVSGGLERCLAWALYARMSRSPPVILGGIGGECQQKRVKSLPSSCDKFPATFN